MTQDLSTLMDGELDGQEAERALRNCCGNEELKLKWQAYHLIGDALRGECPCRRAATDRIMAAIRDEPTVLAPRRRMSGSAGRIAFAAAASVATVAVVAWIGMQDRGAPDSPLLATSTPVAPAAAPLVASAAGPLNVNDYMVVHRQVPNADFYLPASNTAVRAR
jgi:sigma-E factor negative regulatory protein RseA